MKDIFYSLAAFQGRHVAHNIYSFLTAATTSFFKRYSMGPVKTQINLYVVL